MVINVQTHINAVCSSDRSGTARPIIRFKCIPEPEGVSEAWSCQRCHRPPGLLSSSLLLSPPHSFHLSNHSSPSHCLLHVLISSHITCLLFSHVAFGGSFYPEFLAVWWPWPFSAWFSSNGSSGNMRGIRKHPPNPRPDSKSAVRVSLFLTPLRFTWAKTLYPHMLTFLIPQSLQSSNNKWTLKNNIHFFFVFIFKIKSVLLQPIGFVSSFTAPQGTFTSMQLYLN